MISADDFIAQNAPRSALEPFHQEIAKLRAANMSYQKIQYFLKLNGVDTHVNNVRGYCQRHIENKATPLQKGREPAKATKKKTVKSTPQKKQSSLF